MFPCMSKLGCPQEVRKPGVKGFCPLWKITNFAEKNPNTQETRLLTGCFYDISIQMLEHTVRASNRPAAEISAMRGDLINGLTGGLELVLNKAIEAVEKSNGQKVISP